MHQLLIVKLVKSSRQNMGAYEQISIALQKKYHTEMIRKTYFVEFQ